MGQPISMPVMISPTGVQAVHPDGEVAVARAAAARGTAMGLSSFASKPIEEVVAANPQTFFQIYWCGDRTRCSQRVERARAAGAVGLIVTLDWSFSNGRDWGSPFIPDRIDKKVIKSKYKKLHEIADVITDFTDFQSIMNTDDTMYLIEGQDIRAVEGYVVLKDKEMRWQIENRKT